MTKSSWEVVARRKPRFLWKNISFRFFPSLSWHTKNNDELAYASWSLLCKLVRVNKVDLYQLIHPDQFTLFSSFSTKKALSTLIALRF